MEHIRSNLPLPDWYGRLFDATDVADLLHSWVVPRLGPDVWPEAVDAQGAPDCWREVMSLQEADQLCDSSVSAEAAA